MNRRSIKLKWNREFAIAILFFGPQINYYIAALLSMNGRQTLTAPIYAMLFIIGLVSYFTTLRYKTGFFTFFLLCFSLLFSSLINSKATQYMFSGSLFSSSITVMLLVYVPVFLLMLTVSDFRLLWDRFRKFSYVTLMLSFLALGGYLFAHRTTPPDYMSFAYMMLNPIMICFICGTEGRHFDLILSLLGSFVILIVGCRGAVIALAVFFTLYVIGFYIPRGGKKYGLSKILTVLGIITIAVFSEQLLTAISYGLSSIGFTSRTVNKLIAGGGTFIESEGRQLIWNQAINNIGFLGKGLFGDRTVILDEYAHPAYAHNFLLEILVDFGWIVGLILVVFLCVLFIRSVRSALTSESTVLIKLTFAMISIIFAKHMISASFLTSFDFWFYLGLAANLVISREAVTEGGYRTSYRDAQNE